MSKHLSILALFLSVMMASAAERITLLITITNVPVTGNTLTINSSIRTWTNASTASTIQTNLVSTNHATTNLFQQIASYPYAGGIVQQWASSNAFRLIGTFGGALSGLQTGNWASLVLSTQSGPSTFTALWPLENIVGTTNRTNQGSSLVYGLSTYSTQAFATNSTAVSNLLQKGAGPLQTVIGPVSLTSTASVNALYATNGAITNVLVQNELTNRLKYIFVPTGINVGGTNGSAYSGVSVIGSQPLSSLQGYTDTPSTIPVFWVQKARGFEADPTNLLAGDIIGRIEFLAYGSSQYKQALQLWAKAGANISNSLVDVVAYLNIGKSNSSSAGTIQSWRWGTITNHAATFVESNLTVSGVGSFDSLTNNVLRGTNVLNGRLDFTSRANTGLANGLTVGVVLGTNVYVRLSGATTIAAIGGFAAEQDGSFHVVQMTGAVTNILYNDSTDPTTENRIIIGTGADLALTNNPTVFGIIYDGTAQRWRLVSFFR